MESLQKEKESEKPKADKLTEMTALLAFYHNVANLWEDTEKFDDDSVKGVMMREQIDLLLSVHKEFTEKHNIEIPEYKTDLFTEYINRWNELNVNREPYYKELIDKIIGKSDESSSFYI